MDHIEPKTQTDEKVKGKVKSMNRLQEKNKWLEDISQHVSHKYSEQLSYSSSAIIQYE